MHDTVWQPGQEVEDNMLMGGQNIAQIGAIKHIFERWEHPHPNGGSVFTGDEAVLASTIGLTKAAATAEFDPSEQFRV